MTPDESARLQLKYDRRLAEFGYDPRTLGWNKPKQRLRFAVLLEYFFDRVQTPLSLLDVGCGFGDMFRYCEERRWPAIYHGVDLNAKLIEVGWQVFPSAELSVGNPIADGIDRPYDVIVASGTHNYSIADQGQLLEATFASFAANARRGFAVNFLSDQTTFKRPENAYTSAETAITCAMRHSSRVILRHDYMPFEFTIIVDMRTSYDAELTVYPEFLDQVVP